MYVNTRGYYLDVKLTCKYVNMTNNLFMSVLNLVLLTYFIYVHVIIVAGQLVTNEHVL